VINIKSTIVGAAEVKDIENLPPEPGQPPFKGLHFDEQDAGHFFGANSSPLKRGPAGTPLPGISASGGKSRWARRSHPGLRRPPGGRRGERLADGALPPPTVRPAGRQRTAVGYTPDHPSAHPGGAGGHAGARRPIRERRGALQQELAANPRAWLRRPPAPVRPAGALAQAGHTHLLLVVDQFEEIFTLCRSAAERQAFMTTCWAAAGSASFAEVDPEDGQPITLLIALRADFTLTAPARRAARIVSRQQEYISHEPRGAFGPSSSRLPWETGRSAGPADLMLDEVQTSAPCRCLARAVGNPPARRTMTPPATLSRAASAAPSPRLPRRSSASA
jgi:hypothetical protein